MIIPKKVWIPIFDECFDNCTLLSEVLYKFNQWVTANYPGEEYDCCEQLTAAEAYSMLARITSIDRFECDDNLNRFYNPPAAASATPIANTEFTTDELGRIDQLVGPIITGLLSWQERHNTEDMWVDVCIDDPDTAGDVLAQWAFKIAAQVQLRRRRFCKENKLST